MNGDPRLAGGDIADAIAVMLEGRVNQSPDRTRILYLTDSQGAADIVAHLLALAARNGGAEAFADAINASAAWSTE